MKRLITVRRRLTAWKPDGGLLILAVLLLFAAPVSAGENHTTAACGTSTTTALAADAARTYVMFINDSDTVIYLKVGASAVVNEGVRINANGGSWEMSTSFGNESTTVINCIHGGSGTKVLTVYEVDLR